VNKLSNLHDLVVIKGSWLGVSNKTMHLRNQAQLLYSRLFASSTNTAMDFHWRSEAALGTILSGVSTGFVVG
jgi:hypothetical protein